MLRFILSIEIIFYVIIIGILNFGKLGSIGQSTQLSFAKTNHNNQIIIKGKTSVCKGESIELTAYYADESNDNEIEFIWYQEQCGGQEILSRGKSIIFTPKRNTSYFVSMEGKKSTIGCKRVEVKVIGSESKKVGNIDSRNGTVLCKGESTKLQAIGGELAEGAKYRWYTEECGGTSIGVGESITVTPKKATEYFVRAEGACNWTDCASINIIVSDQFNLPKTIIQDQNIYSPEDGTTLRLDGVNGIGKEWYWYEGKCETPQRAKFLRRGTEIKVYPKSTTTYFAQLEEGCKDKICLQKKVTVSKKKGPIKMLNGILLTKKRPRQPVTKARVIILGLDSDETTSNGEFRLDIKNYYEKGEELPLLIFTKENGVYELEMVVDESYSTIIEINANDSMGIGGIVKDRISRKPIKDVEVSVRFPLIEKRNEEKYFTDKKGWFMFFLDKKQLFDIKGVTLSFNHKYGCYKSMERIYEISSDDIPNPFLMDRVECGRGYIPEKIDSSSILKPKKENGGE